LEIFALYLAFSRVCVVLQINKAAASPAARTNACFIVGFYSARPPTRPNKSQTVKRAAALQLLKLSFASSLRSGKHFHLLRDRPGKFTRALFLSVFNFSSSSVGPNALRN
jgi:hypothetical protein